MKKELDAPRLFEYLQYRLGKLLPMDRASWDSIQPLPGKPRVFDLEASPLASIMYDAQIRAATLTRTSTGAVIAEVFRFDRKDAPYCINKDRYLVMEDIGQYIDLDGCITAASTSPSPSVRRFRTNVFWSKQAGFAGHWQITLPSTVLEIINCSQALQ